MLPGPAASSTDCAQFERSSDVSGTEVEISTTIVAPEDQPFLDTFVPFTDCTGITGNDNGSQQFEAQLPVRVQSGNAPDPAFLPQPGLLARMVETGEVVAPPKVVVGQVDENRSADWKGCGTVDGTCSLHRQASSSQADWPEGTVVAEDGDVFAFPFPTIDPEFGDAAVGGGEFVAAFSDEPRVQALQHHLSTAEWADAEAVASGPGWVSSDLDLDPANLESPIDRLVAEQFQDPDPTSTFDASDLVPAAVGSDAEFEQLTEWVAGDQSDQDTLDDIEAARPAS